MVDMVNTDTEDRMATATEAMVKNMEQATAEVTVLDTAVATVLDTVVATVEVMVPVTEAGRHQPKKMRAQVVAAAVLTTHPLHQASTTGSPSRQCHTAILINHNNNRIHLVPLLLVSTFLPSTHRTRSNNCNYCYS